MTFYGAANPPATYGGVGGTTPDVAKYSFQVPETWKEEAVGKVDKGAGGIDCRFRSGKTKQVYVVSLKREGEDAQDFALQDPTRTLKSVSGADPALQEALNVGTVSVNERKVGSQSFIEYDIDSTTHWRISITVDAGRLFGMFITAPERLYPQNEALYSSMLATFKTYGR